MSKREVTPSADWPVGRRILLLDPYLRNPVQVKIIRHPNPDHLVCEDDRGIVYYARTDRVDGFVDAEPIDDFAKLLEEFADILG